MEAGNALLVFAGTASRVTGPSLATSAEYCRSQHAVGSIVDQVSFIADETEIDQYAGL
jgi:hypothetical protein